MFQKKVIPVLISILEIASLLLIILPFFFFFAMIVNVVHGDLTAIQIVVKICKYIFTFACGIALFILSIRIEKSRDKKGTSKKTTKKKDSSSIPPEMMEAMNGMNGMNGNMAMNPEMMNDIPSDVVETVENPVHVEDVQPTEQDNKS